MTIIRGVARRYDLWHQNIKWRNCPCQLDCLYKIIGAQMDQKDFCSGIPNVSPLLGMGEKLTLKI